MVAQVRRPRRLGIRGWLLCGLLAALLVVLAFAFPSLQLSYCLHSAERSIRAHDYPGAIATLMQSQGGGQRSAQWHYLLACARRRAGQLGDVEAQLEQANRLGWDPVEISRQRLLLKAQSGEIKKVEGELAALFQVDQTNDVAEEIYEALARGYLSSFHVADARRCLKYWSQWQPTNELPLLWTADLLRRIENPVDAAAAYRQVLSIRPRHSEARIRLAQIQLQLFKMEEAEALFQQSVDDREQNPAALLGLAEIRRRQGATDAARTLFYDALVQDLSAEQRAEVLGALGQMALEERQYAPATQLLQDSIAANPYSIVCYQTLAAAYSASGDEERAKQTREQASKVREQDNRIRSAMLKTVDEPGNADHRCQVGLLLLEQDPLSGGADWLKTALELDPNHRAAHRGLADYYEKLGDFERAQEHRAAADKASPRTPTAAVPKDE